jgi:cytochrome c553
MRFVPILSNAFLSPLRVMLKATFAIAIGLLACLAARCAQADPAQFKDTMAERTRSCTACHGAQGRAGPDGYYPRLAGKPAQYLYNQLIGFQEGRRHYAPMEQLIGTLDARYLHEMADYFSALSLPYSAPKVATTRTPATAETQRAERLVRTGDTARGIPACAQCHGIALTGTRPQLPGLLGLPADYINAQLGGWRNGQRAALAPDCMARVAQRLSPGDISAVSTWLAAQTMPGSDKPADKRSAVANAAVDIDRPEWQCGPVKTTDRLGPASPTISSANAQTLERGAYLAHIGNCAVCHTARGGAPYAGGRPIDTPFGPVMSSNITSDKGAGIGQWTANDFWQALHHGISKDGHALYPAFPYTNYTRVNRDDADAIFAFLQTLPPSPQPNQPHKLLWPYSSPLALTAWRWIYFKPVEFDNTVQRGDYLTNGLGHCDACHAERNFLGAPKTTAANQAGGYELPGSAWYAPPLQASALQRWSGEQLKTFLQTGASPHGYAAGPMAEVVLHGTQYLTLSDAQAMADYLKGPTPSDSVNALSSVTIRGTPANAKGVRMYEQFCADCHGKSGEGRSGAYPALAANPKVLGVNVNNLVLQLLYGGYPAATARNPRPFGMPPFVLTLNDADMAAVLSYIRNTWGNHADSVTEFDINKLRTSLSKSR